MPKQEFLSSPKPIETVVAPVQDNSLAQFVEGATPAIKEVQRERKTTELQEEIAKVQQDALASASELQGLSEQKSSLFEELVTQPQPPLKTPLSIAEATTHPQIIELERQIGTLRKARAANKLSPTGFSGRIDELVKRFSNDAEAFSTDFRSIGAAAKGGGSGSSFLAGFDAEEKALLKQEANEVKLYQSKGYTLDQINNPYTRAFIRREQLEAAESERASVRNYSDFVEQGLGGTVSRVMSVVRDMSAGNKGMSFENVATSKSIIKAEMLNERTKLFAKGLNKEDFRAASAELDAFEENMLSFLDSSDPSLALKEMNAYMEQNDLNKTYKQFPRLLRFKSIGMPISDIVKLEAEFGADSVKTSLKAVLGGDSELFKFIYGDGGVLGNKGDVQTGEGIGKDITLLGTIQKLGRGLWGVSNGSEQDIIEEVTSFATQKIAAVLGEDGKPNIALKGANEKLIASKNINTLDGFNKTSNGQAYVRENPRAYVSKINRHLGDVYRDIGLGLKLDLPQGSRFAYHPEEKLLVLVDADNQLIQSYYPPEEAESKVSELSLAKKALQTGFGTATIELEAHRAPAESVLANMVRRPESAGEKFRETFPGVTSVLSGGNLPLSQLPEDTLRKLQKSLQTAYIHRGSLEKTVEDFLEDINQSIFPSIPFKSASPNTDEEIPEDVLSGEAFETLEEENRKSDEYNEATQEQRKFFQKLDKQAKAEMPEASKEERAALITKYIHEELGLV